MFLDTKFVITQDISYDKEVITQNSKKSYFNAANSSKTLREGLNERGITNASTLVTLTWRH